MDGATSRGGQMMLLIADAFRSTSFHLSVHLAVSHDACGYAIELLSSAATVWMMSKRRRVAAENADGVRLGCRFR